MFAGISLLFGANHANGREYQRSPVQIGSHYECFETNTALTSDRERARVTCGFNRLVMGPLEPGKAGTPSIGGMSWR